MHLARPLDPVHLQARWLAAMRRGDLSSAWALGDVVLAGRDPAERDDPRLPYHLRWVWDGRRFDGRHVLVRCYHGLGDTLMFARYLAPLRRRAASVTLEAQPELVPLLATLPGPDRILPFRVDAPAPPAECDIEAMELAHALRAGTGAEAVPYLAAPPDLVAQARGIVRSGRESRRFAVGLCWQAGGWDPDRSVPLGDLLPALAGCHLVSLQRGPAAAEAVQPEFLNPRDRSTDMLRTAALVAAVDLIVTVDTMVAHLAGALGRPAWLLLKRDADWRWMQGRSDSPWYPTLRLYRQARAGAWRAPLAALAADLARIRLPAAG
jgi:hypothetical protein